MDSSTVDNWQLWNKLSDAKFKAQKVLELWPDEAGSYSDLEHAIELLGRSEDLLEAVAQEVAP